MLIWSSGSQLHGGVLKIFELSTPSVDIALVLYNQSSQELVYLLTLRPGCVRVVSSARILKLSLSPAVRNPSRGHSHINLRKRSKTENSGNISGGLKRPERSNGNRRLDQNKEKHNGIVSIVTQADLDALLYGDCTHMGNLLGCNTVLPTALSAMSFGLLRITISRNGLHACA